MHHCAADLRPFSTTGTPPIQLWDLLSIAVDHLPEAFWGAFLCPLPSRVLQAQLLNGEPFGEAGDLPGRSAISDDQRRVRRGGQHRTANPIPHPSALSGVPEPVCRRAPCWA